MPTGLSDILQFFKSLSFGGLLGGGLLFILYNKYPLIFTDKTKPEYAFIFGSVLGGTFHNLLSKLFTPLTKRIGYYTNLIQLISLRNTVDPEKIDDLIEYITIKQFAGEQAADYLKAKQEPAQNNQLTPPVIPPL